MKKIDLHIHTVATTSDSEFIFSMDCLKRYVLGAGLDAIAITNHDVFDADQFRRIKESLSVAVLPGIEINVDNGHLLLISDGLDVADFDTRCQRVSDHITDTGGSIGIDKLRTFYGDLAKYLVIPHYHKGPAIEGQTLEDILPYTKTGEVDSAKKFIRAIKDKTTLTPVLFSDARMSEELTTLPTRQTYVDCGDLSLKAIKACLADKDKVSLSARDGNTLFPVFADGQHISTGLNVLLGDRSSGKTYTLDKLYETYDDVKYIRQFSLVQRDEAAYEKEFNSDVQRKRSCFVDEYLAGFKSLLDDVMSVDMDGNDRAVDRYVSSLLKSAEDADRRDAYSKVALFDEMDFPVSEDDGLKQLIASVRHLIENVEYHETIERHVELSSLRSLACELIELFWSRSLDNKKKHHVNGLIKDVKEGLRLRTSATQVDNVDLYRVSMESKKVERFSEIVWSLQHESPIFDENVQGFRIVATKGPFTKAGEIRAASGGRASFTAALKEYRDPYRYLRSLMENDNLDRSRLYELFAKITYKILNRDGYEVSGGERSEFRLLQEIKDAQNHDLLLIDEPESSFDNMFLKSDVNQMIKEIAQSMPVVVVTHNSTVGATIRPDYLLVARKESDGGTVSYRLYSGHPTDKTLRSVDGKTVRNHEMMMNSLEAGIKAYEERGLHYEAIED